MDSTSTKDDSNPKKHTQNQKEEDSGKSELAATLLVV